MLEDLPVLGICGGSGSGRTNLIEQVMPHLCRRHLKVAVLRQDGRGAPVDADSCESDRLVQAGADVLQQGPSEQWLRVQAAELPDPLLSIEQFIGRYDLVLVEGGKHARIPKVWLLAEGETDPPAEGSGILKTLPAGPSRGQDLLDVLDPWLAGQCVRAPVFGCVLIGGPSSRMGQPKHLICRQGRTWLERSVEVLSRVTQRVVVVGGNAVPAGLADCVRLPDVVDAEGPLSGLLAAMRWAPRASWVAMACDMPLVDEEALQWLLSYRRPGAWAVLPVARSHEGVEPLLAWYDFRARELLEGLARRGQSRLRGVAGYREVLCPEVPAEFKPAWRNINTQDDLQAYLPCEV